MTKTKPTIAMVLGDPSGIGPELVAKLLAVPGICHHAHIFLVADKQEFFKGQTIAGMQVPFLETASFQEADFRQGLPVLLDYRGTVTEAFTDAKATREGGLYCLETLKVALELTHQGLCDAMCFAPLNKEAMHLAGMTQNDELHWFADMIGFEGHVCELNVLKELWTSRVTSHVALKDVSHLITKERVLDAIGLIHHALCQAGVANPRIGVAALNPHAGDGGNFGHEEIDEIEPGIELARQKQIQAEGPFPSDTVFIKAFDGKFDAVVTMYHDQGQIAMKLTGFERGVSVQGGLPIPITTPAHGTAFDIMGQGKANLLAMQHAFDLACSMGKTRRLNQ